MLEVDNIQRGVEIFSFFTGINPLYCLDMCISLKSANKGLLISSHGLLLDKICI